MTSRSIVAVALALSLAAPEAVSGDRSNPRGMGMGQTVNATVRQFDALGINPALLGVRGRGMLSVGLAKVGVGLSSDFLTYDIYNDYFTGTLDGNGEIVPTYHTDADKQRILAEFPDDVGTVYGDGEAGFLGLSLFIDGVGGFGFSATDHIGGKAMLSKDYARERLKLVDWRKNTPDIRPGDPYPFEGRTNPFLHYLANWTNLRTNAARPTDRAESDAAFRAGTTSIQAADDKGWVISVTPSGGWLPACIAGRTGIGMSQRMQSFVSGAMALN